MICRQIVIPLLVVIAMSERCITVQLLPPCTAALVGQTFCQDCKTAVKCTSGGTFVTVTKCAAGTACGLYTVSPGNSVAGCKTISNTPCKCSTTKMCDAYDPLMLWSCINGALYLFKTCVSPLACSAGGCAAIINKPSPITGVCLDSVEPNFIYMDESCTSAGICTAAGKPKDIIKCNAGQYFDTINGDCIPAPPQPCEGCVGACPDKTNCSNWYICGSPMPALIDRQQCPETQYFDAADRRCVIEDTKCSIETACNFASTITESTVSTTVTSSTTSTTVPVTSSTTSTTVPITSSTTSITMPVTSSTTSTTVPVTSSTTSTTVPVTTSTTSTTVPVTSSTTSTTVKRNTNMPATCTAANVGKSYEYPEDCKKYNACRLITTTTYGYVVGTCSGTLVFNPTTSFCDLPVNVPSCKPKNG